MNIAVFADVHGRILLCFQLCARWQRETGQKIDLILQAGDLGAFPDPMRLDRATKKHARSDGSELGFSRDFVRHQPEVAKILKQTQCPMIFVRGNHEDHHWLDALEMASQETIFPVDIYQRIYCLKTGIPYTFQSGNEQISILGIGRVGSPVREQPEQKMKYIQPYELERIYAMRKASIDVLLTHDAALDSITPGLGIEEIRSALNQYQPAYQFFGHYGGPCSLTLDENKKTTLCKLADLHWTRAQTLEDGAMGILRWHDKEQQSFEVLTAEWLKEYSSFTWRNL